MQEEQKNIEWNKPAMPGDMPDMPDTIIPEIMRDWITEIASSYSCQKCVPVTLFMTALSGLVGSRVGFRPYEQNPVTFYPNLWGGVVAEPGSGKSPILDASLAPIREVNQQIAEQREHEKAARKAAQDELDMLIDEAKSALKDGGSTDELTVLYEKQEALKSRGRYLILNDSTVEALGEIMRSNPGGILLERDELAGFLRSMDREGAQGSREFMLEAWQGGRTFTQHRIKRGDVVIHSATLSVIGGIQPGKLKTYITDATSEDSDKNDGLIQRLQLVTVPHALPYIARDGRCEPPESLVARLFDIDEALPHEAGETGWNPLYIERGEGVTAYWLEWLQSWVDNYVSYERQAHIRGHFSKYRSLMPSLATLFTLLDGRGTVEVEDMKQAAQWCEYMSIHARAMYAMGQEGQSPTERLIKCIQSGKIKDGVLVSILAGRQKILGRDTKNILPGALSECAQLGWIRVEIHEKGEIVRVNPACFSTEKEAN